MSKAAREYHLIDLVGTSHGGFETLAGARPRAPGALPAWDIFHGDDRVEYHDPDDRVRSERKHSKTFGCVCCSTTPPDQIAS